MDKKIEKILNDLYMIDGSFKKHEEELVKIIRQLLEARPDVEVDERFINELRIRLGRRAEHMKEENAANVGAGLGFSRFAYSMAGIIAILVITVFSFNYISQWKKTPGEIAIGPGSNAGINKLKNGAFGSLAFNQSKTSSSATGAFGKGGGASVIAGKEIAAMPVPDIVNYRYVYKGGDFQTQENAMVYRRVKDIFPANGITDALKSLNLGLIDIGKFKDMGLNSVNLTENRDFGYDINLDFKEGMIYVYAGANWPNPYTDCGGDQLCYEKNQLKESDVPADEELITIANKFLSDYRIDRSFYGEPRVIKDNIIYYASSLSPENKVVSVPETVIVLYPLKISGQEIYSGDPYSAGMITEVSVRHKRVFGVRNIYSQKYESSDYAAEQDKAKIISSAENGGTYGNYQSPEASKTVDVELGTPTVALVATWNYNPEKMTSENLYVPSYVFPITKVTGDQYFWRKDVIVPIPKELFEKNDQTPGTGIFRGK